MDRKTTKAAIAALRKERQGIAWDANCARLFETGNAYQERCLERYIVLTAQIEALEAEVNTKSKTGQGPSGVSVQNLPGQPAFVFETQATED